jgi:parallel beta-helix repeat protein
VIAYNTVSGNGDAGIYVGDSPHAETVVSHNRAYRNKFGVFVRHSRHVQVAANTAFDNCAGIYVLDDGQPGGVSNVTVTGNAVLHNNQFCGRSDDDPLLQGGGIDLVGATDSVVANNTTLGNTGRSAYAGGIVLLKSPFGGGTPATRNTVRSNIAFKSRPDITTSQAGGPNTITGNSCHSDLGGDYCRQ